MTTTPLVEVVVTIVIQLVGSLLILAAFALAQWGVLDAKSVRYLALNVVGSAILAVDAALGAQWGFLLLEGVWAVVSTISLAVALRARGAHRTDPRGLPASGE